MIMCLICWFIVFDNFEVKMVLLLVVCCYGCLICVIGLVLEVIGFQFLLGVICIIECQDGFEIKEVELEVVGFNGQCLFLMLLEEVEGILFGVCVYVCNGYGDGL